ncbi:hypothetical protein [Carnimonas bestiolae]|uniref:hypothetical protein n=1 Tax=Carnimonas bestiolae TaxID=3402172 RepID=UPI003EDCB166
MSELKEFDREVAVKAMAHRIFSDYGFAPERAALEFKRGVEVLNSSIDPREPFLAGAFDLSIDKQIEAAEKILSDLKQKREADQIASVRKSISESVSEAIKNFRDDL